MPRYAHIPLVEITRGGTVESIHYGSMAISFYGRKTISIGDSIHPFFLRSSSKPFQSLAFLERGGINKYDFSNREIALFCASHSGTDAHVEVLNVLQEKIGVTEDFLQCGLHYPLHNETTLRMQKNDEPLHHNRHNCSGKHTGMLAFSKMISAPMDSYLDHSHPVQKYILSTFAEMCDVDVKDVQLGIDGCSAPVFAVPLTNAADAYAKLCQPGALSAKRAEACRAITAAMTSHPDMVAGPDRFDTDIMRTTGGKIVSKIGAEGYHGIGVIPKACPHFENSIGITVKISDGDLTLRAGSAACLAALEKLDIVSEAELASLKQYYRRPIQNWRNKDVGEIRPTNELIEALEAISL